MAAESGSTTHGWDPARYLEFADHRLRPARELLGRVPLSSPRRIFDLGCGTGQVTREIAARFPTAAVTGVDGSEEMLARAAAEPGSVRWIRADIRSWNPGEPADLIFSNAALHWVEGHAALFRRLTGHLTRGGCLAVQMPLSWTAPSHRLMRETLADGGPNATALGSEELRERVARRWVGEPRYYYDLLAEQARSLDIWETEYLQVLEGEDAVLRWVEGTGLRPILESLADPERSLFLAQYARRLRAAYPPRADGRTPYPFRRLFVVATL